MSHFKLITDDKRMLMAQIDYAGNGAAMVSVHRTEVRNHRPVRIERLAYFETASQGASNSARREMKKLGVRS